MSVYLFGAGELRFIQEHAYVAPTRAMKFDNESDMPPHELFSGEPVVILERGVSSSVGSRVLKVLARCGVGWLFVASVAEPEETWHLVSIFDWVTP